METVEFELGLKGEEEEYLLIDQWRMKLEDLFDVE